MCVFGLLLGAEEKSRLPMDYAHLMMKLSAERLIWKRTDLPLCVDWNGYISLLSVCDSDHISNRLTRIAAMFWSPRTLGCTLIHITTLYPLELYGCILHFFLNTPIPLPDHPESIIRSSCEVISLLVLAASWREPISQPCSVFDTDVGFRHAQRWRPQRRTIMTTAANWGANGASLEDCHSNIFSLVQYQ